MNNMVYRFLQFLRRRLKRAGKIPHTQLDTMTETIRRRKRTDRITRK